MWRKTRGSSSIGYVQWEKKSNERFQAKPTSGNLVKAALIKIETKKSILFYLHVAVNNDKVLVQTNTQSRWTRCSCCCAFGERGKKKHRPYLKSCSAGAVFWCFDQWSHTQPPKTFYSVYKPPPIDGNVTTHHFLFFLHTHNYGYWTRTTTTASRRWS